MRKSIINNGDKSIREGIGTPKDVDGIEINFIDPKTGDMLILDEYDKSQQPDPAAVTAPGFDGKIITKTDPFPYTILTWEKNGIFFKLGAVNTSEAEIIKVAKSLKSVN